MRLLPAATLCLLLPACAGNLADHIGPRSAILEPELVRYGLDPARSECIGARLGNNLSPLQLRRLARSARALQRSYSNANRLAASDLLWISRNQNDAKVALEVEQAIQGCATIAAGAAGAQPPTVLETRRVTDQAPPATGAANRPPTWVNLGAAATGQSIGVDAASIEKAATGGTAWFRLTNPGSTQPSGTSYRLRIDCAAKTITTMSLRKAGANGAPEEQRDYGPAGEAPLPVESGTVMEIAYLSLCT